MIGTTFFFPWEITLIVFIQSFLQPWVFNIFFSFLGEEIVFILVLGFFYCYDKEFGKKLSLLVAMGIIFNTLTKNFFTRRRPYFDNSSIKM